MAYIFKKQVRGETCWYLGENQRINGMSRRIWQKYIGNSRTIKKKLLEGIAPAEIDSLECGCIAALLTINDELKFSVEVDKIIPKRNQGLTMGGHLLLTIINRIDSPLSRNKLSEWFNETILKKHFVVKSSYLSSQDFWNHWNKISQENIDNIQERLIDNLLKKTKTLDL